MEEDDLDILLRQMGIEEPTGRDTWRPQRPSRDQMRASREDMFSRSAPEGLREPEGVGYAGTGFWGQLSEGFLGAVSAPASILPGIEGRDTPEPVTPGEHVGSAVGQFLGWAGLSALAGATLGKGAVAASAAAGATAKTGLASQAVKWGTAEGALGALYAHDEDMPPGEIAKHAGYGAALGVAAPVIGKATRGIRTDMMNRLRRSYAQRFDRTFRGTPEAGLPRADMATSEQHLQHSIWGRETQAQHALGLPDDIGLQKGLAPGEETAKRISDLVQQEAMKRGRYDRLIDSVGSALDTTSDSITGPFAQTIKREAKKRKFEQLSPQEQISTAIRGLWDDEHAKRILKPALRRTEDSAWRGRKMMTGLLDGNPLFAEHHRIGREALGQKAGVRDRTTFENIIGRRYGYREGELIPDDIHQRSLREQIDFIDESIKFNHQKRAQFLERRGVWSGNALTGDDLQNYEANIRRVDELLKARHRLIPEVESAFGEYRQGAISAAMAQSQREAAEEARGQFATRGNVTIHQDLVDILRREGVSDPRQLSREGQDKFYQRRYWLRMQGEQTEIDNVWHLNPDEVFTPETAEYMRDEWVALPDIGESTSYDDVLRIQTPNWWDRLLAPFRAVMGEADFREIRTATTGQKYAMGPWDRRVDDLYNQAGLKDTFLEGRASRELKQKKRKAVTRWLHAPDREVAKRDLEMRGLWDENVQGVAEEVDKIYGELAQIFNIPKERIIQNFSPRRHATTGAEFLGDNEYLGFEFASHELRTGFSWPQEMDSLYLLKGYIRGGMREKFLKPTFKNLDKRWDPEGFFETVNRDMRRFLDTQGIDPNLTGKRLQRQIQQLPTERQREYQRLAQELSEAKNIRSQFRKGEIQVDPARKDMYRKLKQNLQGQPASWEHALDRSIGTVANALFGMDPHKRYTREISTFLTDLMYSSTISWNLFTPIKNLTQQLLPVMHLDENPMVGLQYWARAQKMGPNTTFGKISDMTNIVMDTRLATEALARQDHGLRRLSPKMGQFIDKGYGFYKWADKKNVRTSHTMKLLYELDKGTSWERAVEEAYSFTMSTQFMYGIDSPMLYKGELGRALGVLMSWPLNYAHLIRQQAVNEGAWKKAAQMFTGGAVLAETMSESGLSFESVNPMQTASGLLPVSMLEGSDRWPILLRAGAATGNYLRALGDGDPQAQDWARKEFGRMARTFVPAGTQIGRAWEGVETLVNEGRRFDQQDRLQHEVEGREKFWQFIGPTTEQSERWRHLQAVASQQSNYRRLRGMAYDALYEGDMERFAKLQDQLVLFYGKGIESHEAQQHLEMAQLSSLERTAMGLPEESRKAILDELEEDWLREPEEELPLAPF